MTADAGRDVSGDLLAIPANRIGEPTSGRSEPHPAAAPAHALTWRPEIDRTDHDAAYWAPLLVVECEPCGWRRTLTGTYTTGQLDRLDAMHCGGES